MDETDRRDFRLAEEDMMLIVMAQNSTPVMGLTARVDTAWKIVGTRLGFDHSTVRAPLESNDPYVVSAIPLEK
jgi:hypothetical protein